jgi:UDP-N-acetylmuramate--alanine ligase
MHFHDNEERIRKAAGEVPSVYLMVDTSKQQLHYVNKGKIFRSFPVSTSARGVGNREGSFQTPQGVHRIAEKYGAGAPIGRIFKDRIDTGEDWPVDKPGENMVLTRILRLEGLEDGVNRGPGIDSYERYIYIHGAANEFRIGRPQSQGCVCMKNADAAELFDMVGEGALVVID